MKKYNPIIWFGISLIGAIVLLICQLFNLTYPASWVWLGGLEWASDWLFLTTALISFFTNRSFFIKAISLLIGLVFLFYVLGPFIFEWVMSPHK